jgi:hypothetical protein
MPRPDLTGRHAGCMNELSMTKKVGLMSKVLLLVVGCVAALLVCGGSALAVESGGGRAFELVSPPEKAGNEVDIIRTVQGAPDGNGVAFSSSGAFGDAQANMWGGYYVSRRSGEGWRTHGVDAPQNPKDHALGFATSYLSDDLTEAFQFSGAQLAPGAVDGGNLYLSDLLTGARRFLAGDTTDEFTREMGDFTGPRLQFPGTVSANGDLSHVMFQSSVALLPEAPPGVRNVYEFTDGRLRLVNVMPDGTIDPTGGSIYSAGATVSPRFVSADGSKIFFGSGLDNGGSPKPLYVRINGTTTVPLSVSRRAGDPSTPVPAKFMAASKDGNIVYFMSITPLTDDAHPTNYGEIYKYDFRTDTLTDVMGVTDPADAGFQGLINNIHFYGVSEDGQYAYFTSDSKLTSDATVGALNFYVVHAGTPTLIPANINFDGYLPTRGRFAMSPNGRFIAFTSAADVIPGVDHTDPSCKADPNQYGNGEGVCVEVYVYDAVRNTMSCPGCATIDGRHALAELSRSMAQTVSQYPTRTVSDDGRVYFHTAARLVDSDTNGVRDVYEWQDGKATLISSGRGSAGSNFADASADGRDVFFTTSERLVAADVDGAIDLYDARVGGGLASQAAPPPGVAPCDGDGCQGPVAPKPLAVGVASVSFSNPGNDGPAGRVSRAKVKAPTLVKGSVLKVNVSTPAGGKITATGSRVRSVSRTVSRSGKYSLRVVLSAKAKRALQAGKSKRLKTSVRVSYVPTTGSVSSTTLTVTFKA